MRWRREVEWQPEIDRVATQTVGSPDGINAHTEATREAIESIPRLYVVHDPAKRWTARVGRWRGTDVVGRRQVYPLVDVDG
ncbi:hypothetical protein ES703_114152 [subsurface metagenome]